MRAGSTWSASRGQGGQGGGVPLLNARKDLADLNNLGDAKSSYHRPPPPISGDAGGEGPNSAYRRVIFGQILRRLEHRDDLIEGLAARRWRRREVAHKSTGVPPRKGGDP